MRASEILEQKNTHTRDDDDAQDDDNNNNAAAVFEPLRKLLESGKLDDVVHFILRVDDDGAENTRRTPKR